MTKDRKLAFVVQKHDATRLHYDFRLEINGVMPSWAIPKGPTLDPSQKRLAMKTPDHDLNYRHFEGVLPEDSYGAGPVIIWDQGYYLPEVEIDKGVRKQIQDSSEGKKIMGEGLKKGEVKFQLFGERLNGSFALVKTKNFGPKNAWLLIKHKDKFIKAGFDPNHFTTSVISHKKIEEIAN